MLFATKVWGRLGARLTASHLIEMHTDFSVFQKRLAEACHVRDTTPTRLAKIIGMSPRRIVDLEYLDAKALDIYRLGQIADALDVSLDWLTGRSNVMDVPEMPEPEPPKKEPKPKAKKT